MPTRTEYNECKVCEKTRVKFEYWEGGSDHASYYTNYQEKSSKAFICKECHDTLKRVLKNDGKEICQKCWNKLTWANFDVSNKIKPINGNCQTCHQEKTEQNQKEADIDDTKKATAEINTSRTEKAPNTCTDCKKDLGGETSYYFPDQPLVHWCADCYPKQNNPTNNNPSSNTPSSSSNSTHQANNPPPPQQAPNQEQNIKCCDCQKSIKQGEITHYVPYDPNKKWCEACDLAKKKVYLQARQQILQGQPVNIDQLNTTFAKQQALKVLARIKKREKVNIDQIVGISEEDRNDLKEIQQQIKNGKLATNLGNDPTSQPFYTKSSFWIGMIMPIACLIALIYVIFRWRKAKRAGKKYNWLTNKISD